MWSVMTENYCRTCTTLLSEDENQHITVWNIYTVFLLFACSVRAVWFIGYEAPLFGFCSVAVDDSHSFSFLRFLSTEPMPRNFERIVPPHLWRAQTLACCRGPPRIPDIYDFAGNPEPSWQFYFSYHLVAWFTDAAFVPHVSRHGDLFRMYVLDQSGHSVRAMESPVTARFSTVLFFIFIFGLFSHLCAVMISLWLLVAVVVTCIGTSSSMECCGLLSLYGRVVA